MAPAENIDPSEDTHAKPALLRALGDLALRSALLDASDEQDAATLTRELIAILEVGVEVMDQLERVEAAATESSYGFSEQEETTWIGTRANMPTTVHLADICFAATLELNRALRRLVQANSATEQLVAAETARRKLHRALSAALANSGDPAGTEHTAVSLLKRRFALELESALLVRRMFASFRRALRRAEDKSGEAVLMALRYAAGALATLTTSTHHGTIRLPDRILLSQQRDRLLDWSRAGRPVTSGLQLLEDIWTCADLLRDINRRQELRTHDEALIRELLHPASHGSADWLTRL
ncbi:MAG: hypothetical protein ABW061_02770, partial [Polyangiaceae bacterium]